MRNGKGNISINERARRVYSPGRRRGNSAKRDADQGNVQAEGYDGREEVEDSELADEEYNPYLQQEQRSLVSSESGGDGQLLIGLSLDNIEFDEQNLFDNFKPIFDYSAPNTASLGDQNDDSSQNGGAKKSKYGKSVKLNMALENSVDLLL